MKSTKIVSIAIFLLLLSGCQNMLKTMVPHIRLNSQLTAIIAKTNAYVNFCMSQNSINKQIAYEFSTVAVELLDLVVYDYDFFKNTYDNTMKEVNSSHASSPADTSYQCKSLEPEVPKLTARLQDNYSKFSTELGIARSEENQRIAQSMSNFRVPNTQVPQMNFPKANYSQEKASTQNFLVNTKNGITQCRVTNGNFVFCL